MGQAELKLTSAGIHRFPVLIVYIVRCTCIAYNCKFNNQQVRYKQLVPIAIFFLSARSSHQKIGFSILNIYRINGKVRKYFFAKNFAFLYHKYVKIFCELVRGFSKPKFPGFFLLTIPLSGGFFSTQEVTLELEDGGDEELLKKLKKKKCLGSITLRQDNFYSEFGLFNATLFIQ